MSAPILISLAAVGLLVILACVAAVISMLSMLRLRREVAELRHELAQRDQPVSAAQVEPVLPAVSEQTYVITHLGEQPTPQVGAPVIETTERIDGQLFTDIVARETVAKAGGVVHGVRRALAPETRNRIRFAMKQEVKRARKQRKAEQRQAMREFQARQRAGFDEFSDEVLA